MMSYRPRHLALRTEPEKLVVTAKCPGIMLSLWAADEHPQEYLPREAMHTQAATIWKHVD